MAGWIVAGAVGLVLLMTQTLATAEPVNRPLGTLGAAIFIVSIFALANREQERKENGKAGSATVGQSEKSR